MRSINHPANGGPSIDNRVNREPGTELEGHGAVCPYAGAPNEEAIRATVASTSAGRASLISRSSERMVPRSSTRVGMTLGASPPWMAPKAATTAFLASKVRRMTAGRSVTIVAAAETRSAVRWGRDVWPPGPRRTMVKPSPDASEMRTVLDALATAVSPAPSKLAAERAEHLLLFNLFGDPLLRLHNPQPIGLDLSGSAKPGQVLRIAGTCTVDGPATVELTVRRDRLSFRPPLRSIYPTTSDELSRFQEIYRRANDPRLTSVETAAHDGRFLVEMTIPAYAEGPCNIRAFVEGERTFAMGAVEIAVED